MVDNETPKGDVLKFSNQTVAFVFTEAKIQKLKPRKKTYPVKDDRTSLILIKAITLTTKGRQQMNPLLKKQSTAFSPKVFKD